MSPRQGEPRIAWADHVLTVQNTSDGVQGTRTVCEVWRQYWNDKKASSLSGKYRIERGWIDIEDAQHGFGPTLEAALADLLRIERILSETRKELE